MRLNLYLVPALVAGYFMRGRMAGMNEANGNERDRTRRVSYPFPLLAGVLALALLYAVSYILIATPDNDGTQKYRNFNHQWQAAIFGPAVKIESAIRREPIEYGWWSDEPPK
jgi:hypothetical protein